jgi:Phage tail assembly chaperone protein, TAC
VSDIPVAALFAYAVRDLHLSPAEFWHLTLAEWRWLMESERGLSGDDIAVLKSQLASSSAK